MQFLTLFIQIFCIYVTISTANFFFCRQTTNDLAARAKNRRCPVGCPRIMNPVCAYGGRGYFKYFYNECLLRDNRCRTGRDWQETHMSLCLNQLDANLMKECLRACPFEYNPICATNGKQSDVFGNECILEMENCFSNGKWKQVDNKICDITPNLTI